MYCAFCEATHMPGSHTVPTVPVPGPAAPTVWAEARRVALRVTVDTLGTLVILAALGAWVCNLGM